MKKGKTSSPIYIELIRNRTHFHKTGKILSVKFYESHFCCILKAQYICHQNQQWRLGHSFDGWLDIMAQAVQLNALFSK